MRKLAIALVFLFALGSCLPANAGPGFKVKDVDEFLFFQPCACIDMYYTDGGYYSQPQTDKAAGMVADIINMERFPFSDMIPADYYGDGANADARKWAQVLAETKPRDVSRLRVPKSLITQLNESEDRYGVVIDKQERSVVYYKKQKAPMFNSHPTDYEDVSKMLHKLLRDFIK